MTDETFSLDMLREQFEGKPLHLVQYRGATHVPAKEAGRAMEFGDDGRALVRLIGGKWGHAFTEGVHVVTLAGKERSDFLELLEVVDPGSTTSLKFAPTLMLLTIPGVWAVVNQTKKPIGQRFREWLTTECMPKLQKGEVVHLPGAPDPARTLPAPESTPPALVDPVVRRLEAEAELERARAERIRQERLENARKDRAAMRRAQARVQKRVAVHDPAPVTATPPVPALPAPPPPVPQPTDLLALQRRRRAKKTDADPTGQGELVFKAPEPRMPSEPTGRHPKRHEVDGHWTSQRYGPGRAMTKRIWIKGYERGGREPQPPQPAPVAGSEAG